MKTKWTLPMGITINRHLHDGWDLCVNIRVLGHGSALTYRVTGYENLYSFKPYANVGAPPLGQCWYNVGIQPLV